MNASTISPYDPYSEVNPPLSSPTPKLHHEEQTPEKQLKSYPRYQSRIHKQHFPVLVYPDSYFLQQPDFLSSKNFSLKESNQENGTNDFLLFDIHNHDCRYKSHKAAFRPSAQMHARRHAIAPHLSGCRSLHPECEFHFAPPNHRYKALLLYSETQCY